MEELEVIEIDEEVELEEEATNDLPIEPQTQMEEDNYEIGDTNIQEE